MIFLFLFLVNFRIGDLLYAKHCI